MANDDGVVSTIVNMIVLAHEVSLCDFAAESDVLDKSANGGGYMEFRGFGFCSLDNVLCRRRPRHQQQQQRQTIMTSGAICLQVRLYCPIVPPSIHYHCIIRLPVCCIAHWNTALHCYSDDGCSWLTWWSNPLNTPPQQCLTLLLSSPSLPFPFNGGGVQRWWITYLNYVPIMDGKRFVTYLPIEQIRVQLRPRLEWVCPSAVR